jgi:hypothetical protein
MGLSSLQPETGGNTARARNSTTCKAGREGPRGGRIRAVRREMARAARGYAHAGDGGSRAAARCLARRRR